MRTLRGFCSSTLLIATSLIATSLIATTLHAQTLHHHSGNPSAKPRILGIASVSYYVDDANLATQFWHGLLGFDISATSRRDAHEYTAITINDHQHVYLFATPPAASSHMRSICFIVYDIFQMKSYLHKQGVEATGFTANSMQGGYGFQIKDPEGLTVEFVQPTGALSTKSLAAARISNSIFHVGFTVHHLAKTMDFYQRVLGFTETWRGSSDDKTLSWINMKVPNGTDYVEFMLGSNDDAKSLGTKNHLSLAVPDMDKAAAEIKSRAATLSYTRAIEIHTGKNHKRQVNLYDPDGTRVELMEPFTVDGKPSQPSTAPPPPDQP